VLTEGRSFGGSLTDLSDVRAAFRRRHFCGRISCSTTTCWRKPVRTAPIWSCSWSPSSGEDGEMAALALSHRLEPLVEARDAAEIAIASRSGARLIGINNRDLDTLTVDLSTGARLLPLLPAGCTRSWKADLDRGAGSGLPQGRRPPLPDRGVPAGSKDPADTIRGMWENERRSDERSIRKGAETMKVKFLLKDSEIPKTWYNVMADMPNPPAAVLHPGTGKPVGPGDLAPLFPMPLIEQEVSSQREIPIPEAVRDIYTLWRPTPMFRALRLEEALGRSRRSTTSTRASAPREPQAEHLHPSVLQQDVGTKKDRHRDGGRPMGIRHGPRRLVLRP